MQRSFALELKAVNADSGDFEGIVSTYGGNPDSYNDIVDLGAFTRTLASSKVRPLLKDHRDEVGAVQLADTPQGLFAVGKINADKQFGRDVLSDLKFYKAQGVPMGMSFGFETVDAVYVGDVRHLKEVKLWEVSLTLFPANENAAVTAIKSAQREKLAQLVAEIRSIIPKS